MLAVSGVRAQVFDDSGLTEGLQPDAVDELRREGRVERGVTVFSAEPLGSQKSVEAPQEENRISGTILLMDGNGKASSGRQIRVLIWDGQKYFDSSFTDSSGRWSLPAPNIDFSLWIRLDNGWWSLKDPKTQNPYEWEIGTGTYYIRLDSANGRIAAIHRQYVQALDYLRKSGISLDWWKDTLSVYYPSDGNYFSGFSVHLTQAGSWDVNLHELGHAVLEAGTKSYGGGGQHRITECYNQGLAWSEGFATFLAAAVRFNPGEADPRFEYLAGGIPIENVPDHVCKGDTNEWRVAATLWDFYDSHEDGPDKMAAQFARLWQAIAGKSIGGFPDAWRHIQGALQKQEAPVAAAVLEFNTLTQSVPVAQGNFGSRIIPPNFAQTLTAPAFESPRP